MPSTFQFFYCKCCANCVGLYGKSICVRFANAFGEFRVTCAYSHAHRNRFGVPLPPCYFGMRDIDGLYVHALASCRYQDKDQLYVETWVEDDREYGWSTGYLRQCVNCGFLANGVARSGLPAAVTLDLCNGCVYFGNSGVSYDRAPIEAEVASGPCGGYGYGASTQSGTQSTAPPPDMSQASDTAWQG